MLLTRWTRQSAQLMSTQTRRWLSLLWLRLSLREGRHMPRKQSDRSFRLRTDDLGHARRTFWRRACCRSSWPSTRLGSAGDGDSLECTFPYRCRRRCSVRSVWPRTRRRQRNRRAVVGVGPETRTGLRHNHGIQVRGRARLVHFQHRRHANRRDELQAGRSTSVTRSGERVCVNGRNAMKRAVGRRARQARGRRGEQEAQNQPATVKHDESVGRGL